MATHTRRETLVRRLDHVLPVPSVGAELYKAVVAAEVEYRAVRRLHREDPLPDDALTITITDDEIVISFTIEEPTR